MEGLSALLLALMLFQLAYPWGVGVSRFRDNRHNASDVSAAPQGVKGVAGGPANVPFPLNHAAVC